MSFCSPSGEYRTRSQILNRHQATYEHGFTKASDAQFELVDALLLGRPIRSFPELSLLPTFCRKWHRSYAAIEREGQDWEWLEWHFIRQIPTKGPKLFSLDGTAWPHPAAWALADRQYVFSPTPAVDGGSIVVGHPYSVLAWVPEAGSSWGLPVSIRRALSQQTDVEVGVEQVKHLCRHRYAEMLEKLYLIIADAKYGNHRFLAPLRDEPCGALVRMRRDRVLYGTPGVYSGHGRPRVHGDRFAFKEPETWEIPLRWWNWSIPAGERCGCDVGMINTPAKMPPRRSVSSWSKPTWSGRNRQRPSGWVTSHRHTRRQKTSDWRTYGIGTNTGGQWSPAFASASSISTGHCPASRLQSAAICGRCWSAWHSGSSSWAAIWSRITRCPGSLLRRIRRLSAFYRDSAGFSEKLAPQLHHRKRAESRRDGLQGGLAPVLSDAEWSRRARRSPNRPEIGTKLDC